jgi:lipopolysaccharide transport system ATP-binding protein
MSETVIQVDNLWKKYRLGVLGTGTLRHDVNRWWHRLRGQPDPYAKVGVESSGGRAGAKEAEGDLADDEMWALRGVSFEVKQGEILGIVGRNGAGKSTLLKILSRVTAPTSGEVRVKGRIASLLEVGTGFHPELTGRDNIYLNGAILGMGKEEINRKFDEIVDFSGVATYIDTPVKRYSSGMYVRLAFAVAAYLEQQILVVDEVLAVGDAEFQQKCLGKMKDVASHGRTVLFVSHNIAAVRALCTNAVLLRSGSLEMYDTTDAVITAYTNRHVQEPESHTVRLSQPPEGLGIWIESVSALCNGKPNSFLEMGDKLSLEVRFRSKAPIEKPIIGYLIRSSRGENAVNANNYFLPSCQYKNPVTEGTIICDLGALPLMAGSFSVSFWLCRNPQEQHHVEDLLHFHVEEKNIWGTTVMPLKSLSCFWWPTQFRFSTKE